MDGLVEIVLTKSKATTEGAESRYYYDIGDISMSSNLSNLVIQFALHEKCFAVLIFCHLINFIKALNSFERSRWILIARLA